jgi:hypothetical protein
VIVTVTDTDGSTRDVDLDLRVDSLTLQEAVRLEHTLGSDQWDALTRGDNTTSPSVVRALIWTKLASHVPGVGIDDFDLDIGALAEAATPDPGDVDGLVIPMTTDDGATVEAAVGKDEPVSGTG